MRRGFTGHIARLAAALGAAAVVACACGGCARTHGDELRGADAVALRRMASIVVEEWAARGLRLSAACRAEAPAGATFVVSAEEWLDNNDRPLSPLCGTCTPDLEGVCACEECLDGLTAYRAPHHIFIGERPFLLYGHEIYAHELIHRLALCEGYGEGHAQPALAVAWGCPTCGWRGPAGTVEDAAIRRYNELYDWQPVYEPAGLSGSAD